MRQIDPIRLFRTLLDAGFDTIYLDLNPKRRSQATKELIHSEGKGVVAEPKISGASTLHRQITIAVNSENFKYEDWKNISLVNVEVCGIK